MRFFGKRNSRKRRRDAHILNMEIISSIQKLIDEKYIDVDVNKPMCYMSSQAWQEIVCNGTSEIDEAKCLKLVGAMKMYVNYIRAYRRGMLETIIEPDKDDCKEYIDMMQRIENGLAELATDYELPFVVGNNDASAILLEGTCTADKLEYNIIRE